MKKINSVERGNCVKTKVSIYIENPDLKYHLIKIPPFSLKSQNFESNSKPLFHIQALKFRFVYLYSIYKHLSLDSYCVIFIVPSRHFLREIQATLLEK